MIYLDKEIYPSDIEFYVNSIKNIIYIYNKKANKIKMYYSSDFPSTMVDIIEVDKDFNEKKKTLSLDEVLKEKNDFIQSVNVIASTTKKQGAFSEIDNDSFLKSNYLNIYLNAKTFIQAKNKNLFVVSSKNPLHKILKDNCPTINMLLRNLFYNETDDVLVNFLNWLSFVAFKDENQDIIFLFKGLDKANGLEGQGAGKGILRTLMNRMFSQLIGEVSNSNYNTNFNSRLAHKKIVVFDEVDFKKLDLATLKDISGNPQISIENKGKEALTIQNVSSWLLFTNESDLWKKLPIDDRRVFIICPNPHNGSLKRDIIDIHFNGDYKSFENKLLSEINNFINVLALLPGKVKTPIELRTNAHTNFWNIKATLIDIDNYLDIFLIKKQQTIFIEFLKELVSIGSLDRARFHILSYHLEQSFYYHEIFVELYKICKEHNLMGITRSSPILRDITHAKSRMLTKGFELVDIKTKFKDKEGQQVRIVHKNCYKRIILTPSKDTQAFDSEANKSYRKRIIAFLKNNIKNNIKNKDKEDNVPF